MTIRYAHLAPQQLREGIEALEARGRRPREHGGPLSADSCVTLESQDFLGSA
jgi:hypothetical protein